MEITRHQKKVITKQIDRTDPFPNTTPPTRLKAGFPEKELALWKQKVNDLTCNDAL